MSTDANDSKKKLAGIEMPYLSQFCQTGINQDFVCV